MPKPDSNKPKAPGEAYVWLASTGLTIGLGMITLLLLLVITKGAAAFWPRKVVELTLSGSSEARISDAPSAAGEIIVTQDKIDAAGDSIKDSRELQLFVGNSDIYGFSFRYFDDADIEKRAYPEDLLKIERLKDGPAIGHPVRIEHADRGVIDATTGDFAGILDELIAESEKRWDEIERIEGREMRRLNDRSMKLASEIERLQEADSPDAAAVEGLTAEKTALDTRNDELYTEAQNLRALQTRDHLYFRLATGEETSVALGEIVHYYFPNRLGTAGRLGLFAQNAWWFLTESPRNANTEGGIFPAIYGTFVMTILMCVAVMPLGIIAAVYLREYARQGPVVRAVRIAINNLAGVPSIVFGVFGLGFFVYLTGGTIDRLFFPDKLPTPTFGTGGLLWASLTLALMTVPVIIVATEEALAAVPRGAREGSLACGASKWQTIQRIILPASAPGILTGLVLAMARGAGEVAPLMLVGVVKLAPALPIDLNYPFVHLDQKFMHLGFHIYDLGFQSPDSEAAKPMIFATTLFLIGLVVILNLAAIIIREKLRRRYAVGAF